MTSLFARFNGKRVLVTGHTGFKGAWLCQWLTALGAQVHGYALNPPTQPSLYELVGLAGRMKDQRGDVRDGAALRAAFDSAQPDVVFHLAAQPLVLDSYDDPVGTWESNVTGTVHLLEAVRRGDAPCAVVVVTSDKCYAPRDSGAPFVETDPLGGKDPYSASKAAAELVTASYRNSFFADGTRVRVASARAGNVIGGGDWARNRIVTDAITALASDQAIAVRNPGHVRPWQHVLEPLSGYMTLAAHLLASDKLADVRLTDAWNFGPPPGQPRTVRDVVELLISEWGHGSWNDLSRSDAPVETKLLTIAADKAQRQLGWQPVYDFERTVRETAAWYRAWHEGTASLAALCASQIEDYVSAARLAHVAWAL